MKKQYRQPYTIEGLRQMLTKFLIQHGAYFSFIKNMPKAKYKKFVETTNISVLCCMLDYAFKWEDTDEQYFFWWRLHALWWMELRINGIRTPTQQREHMKHFLINEPKQYTLNELAKLQRKGVKIMYTQNEIGIV